ncbi:hypothetical protein [Sediminitomix flava]|uniref:Uncharacterized protein n=1 Tax=Sediminitomix flava TaxID=379075 RepID=A0A315Z732_SEDFL|nr:hypothetical protein [Sediminitomix flava]PWJ40022.1 hypothetical protein BC781_10585 [Sediminitomix flava]
MIKYTKHFLNKLEDLFAESDYVLRYEKGNFKSGFCVLKNTKIAIINKYYPLEGKVNSLVEIVKTTDMDESLFSEKVLELYKEIKELNKQQSTLESLKEEDHQV